MHTSHYCQYRSSQSGFSVVELMVTISIVVLVTGIALGRYSVFNSAVLLKAQAYQIALDIRQAQAYGISTSYRTGDLRHPFGIYFSSQSGQILDSHRQQYILFQDISTAGGRKNRYDPPPDPPDPNDPNVGDVAVGDPYPLDSRFVVREICIGDVGSCAVVDVASIAFKRPNFNALIWGYDVNGNTGYSVSTSNRIAITVGLANDPNSSTNTIVVTNTGLITVE